MARMGHVGHVRQRGWLAIEVQLLLLFGMAVGASGQTAPSREYVRLGASVIAIENPPLPAVATPTFNPGGGNYTSAVTVTLGSATSGATIRYTIDGSTPTETNGTVATSVTINGPTTLQAIAYKNGMSDSPIASAVYSFPPAATPTFTPGAGSYTTSQTVTISSTAGATIRYTTDGSTPTETNGTVGTSVSICKSTTLKAIAYKSAMADSAVASAAYSFPAVATPTFNPVPGNYTSVTTVGISSATSGATFRYTTDGTTPTETHGTAGTSVTLRSTATLQAMAYKGCTDSSVASGLYTLSGETVSQPSLPSGPTAVATGLTATFTAGGSSSSFGNSVQYIFYWGDGTNSGWLAPGATSASHSWPNGTYSVTVQARSAPNPAAVSAVSTALSVAVRAPYATISMTASFMQGGAWTISITSNMPNQWVNYCGSHDGGAPGCIANFAQTDNNGNQTVTGTFDASSVGSWQQWATFPNVAGSPQSNTLSYTVYPPNWYANLSISATSWAVGGQWTIYINSNVVGQPFSFCGSVNGGAPGCISNFGSTDGFGNASVTGTFDSSSVGSWQQWAVFSAVTSNTISYTVGP